MRSYIWRKRGCAAIIDDGGAHREEALPAAPRVGVNAAARFAGGAPGGAPGGAAGGAAPGAPGGGWQGAFAHPEDVAASMRHAAAGNFALPMDRAAVSTQLDPHMFVRHMSA